MSKYITRIDTSDTFGFEVRMAKFQDGVIINGSKDLVSKFFSDSHYKSQLGCKQAAARWRNNYLRENDVLYLLKQHSRLGVPAVNSKRNTSGVIGVALAVDIKHLVNGGTTLHYGFKGQWCVTLNGKRKQIGNQYSCNVHGWEGAFKLACRDRFEAKGRLMIVDEDELLCYPDVPYLIKEAS